MRGLLADGAIAAAQISADVAGRQSHRTDARNHDVGEILADTLARAKHLAHRRPNRGRARVIFEVAIDSSAEIQRGLEQRPAGGKAGRRVGRELRADRDARRFEDELQGVEGGGRIMAAHRLAHLLPRRRQAGMDPFGAAEVNCAGGDDREVLMGFVDRETGDLVAEVVLAHRQGVRSGTDDQFMTEHALVGGRARRQMHLAVAKRDRRAVGVGSGMNGAQNHAAGQVMARTVAATRWRD